VLKRLESSVDGQPLGSVRERRIRRLTSDGRVWASNVYYLDGDRMCSQWQFDILQLENTVADLGSQSISSQLVKLNVPAKSTVGLRLTLSHNQVGRVL
jgi:hypothetical protein